MPTHAASCTPRTAVAKRPPSRAHQGPVKTALCHATRGELQAVCTRPRARTPRLSVVVHFC